MKITVDSKMVKVFRNTNVTDVVFNFNDGILRVIKTEACKDSSGIPVNYEYHIKAQERKDEKGLYHVCSYEICGLLYMLKANDEVSFQIFKNSNYATIAGGLYWEMLYVTVTRGKRTHQFYISSSVGTNPSSFQPSKNKQRWNMPETNFNQWSCNF